jgi:hypothetical protein
MTSCRSGERFAQTTGFSNKAYVVASAFTFGGEDVIPEMFTNILDKQESIVAPHFRYYLQRHIFLDGDEHGPMAMEIINMLCESDKEKWQEVKLTAITALNLRIRLWDGVLRSIKQYDAQVLCVPE